MVATTPRAESNHKPPELSEGGTSTLLMQPPGDRSGPSPNYQMYFTSGTTGTPKGVVLTQQMVCAHAVGAMREMRLHGGDVWLHAAPMFHLVDAFAMFAVTLAGGRHVILPSFNAR